MVFWLSAGFWVNVIKFRHLFVYDLWVLKNHIWRVPIQSAIIQLFLIVISSLASLPFASRCPWYLPLRGRRALLLIPGACPPRPSSHHCGWICSFPLACAGSGSVGNRYVRSPPGDTASLFHSLFLHPSCHVSQLCSFWKRLDNDSQPNIAAFLLRCCLGHSGSLYLCMNHRIILSSEKPLLGFNGIAFQIMGWLGELQLSSWQVFTSVNLVLF